jgi:hypothetical protein
MHLMYVDPHSSMRISIDGQQYTDIVHIDMDGVQRAARFVRSADPWTESDNIQISRSIANEKFEPELW